MKLNRGQFKTASQLMKDRKHGDLIPDIVFLLLKWWGSTSIIDLNEYKRIRATRTRWGLPWR